MRAALLLGLMACAAQSVAAGSGSGTVNLQIELTPSCSVTTGAGDSIATLNFGQVKPEWTSALSASAEALVTLLCSDGVTAVNVQLDGGVRGDRTLAPSHCHGECQTIPYSVYRDSARTIEYEIDVAQGFAMPQTQLGDSVQMAIPLFGSIPPGSASAWGAYSDTLIMTIDFN